VKKILFNTPLQKKKYFDNVKKLLDSKKSLHGPGKNIFQIKKDLKKLFGFNHVHLTNSCTAAMEMCALMVDLKKSEEVLMPSYNYNTTASSFARTGCKVRYCDIDKKNLMPTFDQIKQNVNKMTKVIVIVHMQGLPIDYLYELKKYCKSKKIILIEDAAPALGSYVKDKPAGSYGDFACFSFHETKNYQSGIGGLLVVNNKKFRRKSDLVFDKGTDRTLVISDPNYHKKYYSWVELGSCFRLPELNASFLQPQIKDINKVIKYRSNLYKRYVKNFQSWLTDEFTICNKLTHKYKYNYHAFTLILKKREREKFLKYLRKNNIIAFISFEALHLSKIGKIFLSKNTKLRNTEEIVKKIVRLPMHNRLSVKDIDFISNKIKKYFSN
jgi:dTDP-4-amino-4,6-dideoxygalactose transaminase|tara:strand:+ start:1561 stop:2709 length:1149 start_codon:yes stop_codon:yes gene_type:complete